MRHEFPSSVKRAALERSEGRCEAIGVRYGYSVGQRCERPVGPGAVNYEHYPRGAHDPHPDTRTLANCTAICPKCNKFANNKHDTPREQKTKDVHYDHALHQARMARKVGIDVPDPPKLRGRQGKKGPPIRTRGFAKGVKQKIPHRPFPKRKS